MQTLLERIEPPDVRANLARIDAIDGLRALAVLAVIAYHLDVPWARGGYLGVSLFFTLSGFLITSGLLGEHRRHGEIDLRGFYLRRLRRLAPSAAVVIAVTCLALVLRHQWTSASRGDAIAVLTYIANWHQFFGGTSYGAMFGPPSPFLHFWSLAIEEQFYFVLPAIVMACLRRSRRLLALVIGGGIAGSIALGRVGSLSGRYFRTDVRAVELLAGCALALVVNGTQSARRRRRRIPGALAALALAVFVALTAIVPVTSPRLHSIVLPFTAIVACVLIVAANDGRGVVARALAHRVPVAIGRASYALYLVHWPVIVLTHSMITRVTLIVAGSILLHVLVERPALALPCTRALGPVAALTAGAAVIVALCTPSLATAATTMPGFGGSSADPSVAATATWSSTRATSATSTTSATAATVTSAPPARPLRVIVLGDSTGRYLGAALANVPGVEVINDARPGCPILDDDSALVQLWRDGPFARWPEQTGNDYACDWHSYLDGVPSNADIVLVVAGPTMTPTYRMVADPDTDLRVDEPAGATWMGAALARFGDAVAAHGTRTAWLTAPPSLNTHNGPQLDWHWRSPERTVAWNQLIANEAARRSSAVVDFAGWFAAAPGHESFRPDGSHLEGAGAQISAAWVAEQLHAVVATGR